MKVGSSGASDVQGASGAADCSMCVRTSDPSIEQTVFAAVNCEFGRPGVKNPSPHLSDGPARLINYKSGWVLFALVTYTL